MCLPSSVSRASQAPSPEQVVRVNVKRALLAHSPLPRRRRRALSAPLARTPHRLLPHPAQAALLDMPLPLSALVLVAHAVQGTMPPPPLSHCATRVTPDRTAP